MSVGGREETLSTWRSVCAQDLVASPFLTEEERSFLRRLVIRRTKDLLKTISSRRGTRSMFAFICVQDDKDPRTQQGTPKAFERCSFFCS